jgi:hypothetical protein
MSGVAVKRLGGAKRRFIGEAHLSRVSVRELMSRRVCWSVLDSHLRRCNRHITPPEEARLSRCRMEMGVRVEESAARTVKGGSVLFSWHRFLTLGGLTGEREALAGMLVVQ